MRVGAVCGRTSRLDRRGAPLLCRGVGCCAGVDVCAGGCAREQRSNITAKRPSVRMLRQRAACAREVRPAVRSSIQPHAGARRFESASAIRTVVPREVRRCGWGWEGCGVECLRVLSEEEPRTRRRASAYAACGLCCAVMRVAGPLRPGDRRVEAFLVRGLVARCLARVVVARGIRFLRACSVSFWHAWQLCAECAL